MKLRLYSTPQSALNLEVTYLAIIEVILSMAIYVGIALYFDTLRHLALAMVLAPLTLFRTPASTELGLRWWRRDWSSFFPEADAERGRLWNVAMLFLYLLGIAVAVCLVIPQAMAIRVGSVAAAFARHPLAAMRAALT